MIRGCTWKFYHLYIMNVLMLFVVKMGHLG